MTGDTLTSNTTIVNILHIRFIEIWSPKWDNVLEMVASRITIVVVSVHKLSHYIKCCRGNSGLVGGATHVELRQTSTKPLKQLPCTANNWMARNYCILDADWLWILLSSWFLATQTACLSLKVVWIYIQVKEINWLKWLEEWVPFFMGKFCISLFQISSQLMYF